MKIEKLLFFPVLALLLSGCAGYRTGSTLDPAIQTVSLSVVNKTDEPSIEVEVMKALRAELQMDGRLAVRSPEDADTSITVTLKEFNLYPLAFNRRHGSLAEEYRMTLTASVVFANSETGEVIHENPLVTADGEFPFSADLTATKRGAMPDAAADLARKVISLTVNGW
jgi:hypothetical protein